jgi:hypothetical protein
MLNYSITTKNAKTAEKYRRKRLNFVAEKPQYSG